MKVFVMMVAVVAAMLGGCATDKARLQVVQDTNDRIERAKKAESDADVALGNALKEVATTKPEVAAIAISNVMLARSLRGGSGAGSAQPFVMPERPRDFLDYVEAGTRLLGAAGAIAVPIVTVRETGQTQRYLAEQNVNLEAQRQSGDTARFVAATGALERLGTAGATANRGSSTVNNTTNTAGGDIANNNSSIARLACEASGGQWNPTVPASAGAVTTPPALSGNAGSGTCTQR